jgi:hypothetical protein
VSCPALNRSPLINTPLKRMGVNLRITARMCRNFIQPEGLADGSRWSRGKRGAATGKGDGGGLHPGRGARTIASLPGCACFWHPSGVHPGNATVSGGRSPLSLERPPATVCQPFGLETRGVCFLRFRAGSKVNAHALQRGVGAARGDGTVSTVSSLRHFSPYRSTSR